MIRQHPLICLPFDPLCGGSGALHSIVTTVLSAICGVIAAGAAWFLTQMGQTITHSSTLTLNATWFRTHYQSMVTLAATVGVAFLCAAGVQAILHASPSIIVRAAFIQLPIAGLFSGVGIEVVQLLLHVTDAIANSLGGGASGTVAKFFSNASADFVNVATAGTLGAPLAVVALGAVLVIVGGFTLWLELLVRDAAVSVAVLFLPLALVAMMWPAIAHWMRRLIDTLIGLILSKVVIVAVLALAVGALASTSSESVYLSAAAMLLLAAFSPFALLRLIPAIEGGATMALEGTRARAQHQVTQTTKSAARLALGTFGTTSFTPPSPGVVGPLQKDDGATFAPNTLSPNAASLNGNGGASESANGAIDFGGDPKSNAAFHAAQAQGPPPMPLRGSGGVLRGHGPLPLWGKDLPNTFDDESDDPTGQAPTQRPLASSPGPSIATHSGEDLFREIPPLRSFSATDENEADQ